ncbi:MAG: hypothetical protein LBQ68_01210 [Clostridiales bacterium]|nr:hypothetical protein [Clostridiales bacterium]
MLSKEIYGKLKQTDVSKDHEKTRERVKATWSTLDKRQRSEVFNISGLKKATLERTGRLGNISAILATALSEVSRIDPYYITAKSDEQRENISEKRIESFLIELGYEDMLIAAQQKVYRPIDSDGAPVTLESEEVETNPLLKTAKNLLEELTEEQKASMDSMSEEEMEYLNKSLNLRARFNEDAKSLLGLLKLILIS